MMTKLKHTSIRALLIIISIYSAVTLTADEFVCGNIDIRNSVKHFNKLEKCTVVEGFVQIVLIDNGTPKDYENLTFPDLREITDYLLLFRAAGLPSLGKLFPNLSVIRGRNLFHDFALVVYEMLQLQQLALKSLTDIVRGAVRIEKNPNLCFVETIDWDRIAKTAKNSHFIHGNKPRQQCPTCGSECLLESSRSSDGKIIGDINGRLCWNSQICQKRLCPEECERNNLTCSSNGHCCDELCLGGCNITISGHKCFSCRGFLDNDKCVKKCPENKFEYLGRRCVTREQCLNISSTIYFKPIKELQKCTPDCPEGYTENPLDRYSCSRCTGFCPKICSSTQVTNIASAQSLKGCTTINGSLEIYIQSGGGNVIRELEENLQQLEEIKDFLKVARSYPLISLNFLKKLRVIHGKTLERGMYSFLVLDNPNLQDLWTFDDNSNEVTKRLQIKDGKIFFHINPKLCYNKIQNLVKYVEMPANNTMWDDHDVSPHSNGDKVACEVSKLNVTIWGVGPEMIGFSFQNFKKQMDDQRSLLGYLIYYRETLHKNVSIFDGRDACSTNVWKVDDFEATGDDDKLSHIIPHLKPYTQYALYIKTYTIASETKGAQSDIIYFKTTADTPSQPRSITARPQSSSEIYIEWEEPSRLNGEVTHYVVTGTRDTDSSDFISQRNYCLEPITLDAAKKIVPEDETKVDLWTKNATSTESSAESSENCCSCKKSSIAEDDTEVEKRISFEDYLINSVYIKRHPNETMSRRKREIIDFNNKQLIDGTTKFQPNLTTSSTTEAPRSHKHYFHRIVASKYVLVPNLSHFTEYTIEVRACHDLPPNNKDNCSLNAVTSVRTLPLGGADDIDESSISVTSENSTHNNVFIVKWDEPLSPNGLIISYHLENKRLTSENIKQTTPECITKSEYIQNKAGWPLVELHPGNYSLRLRANSLAGWGNWTKPYSFSVPEPAPHSYEILFYIVIPVAALVSVSFVLLAGFVFFKYRKNQERLDYVSVNPEYISAGLAYEPDPIWEVQREKVQTGKELGQGSFGMVYEGILYNDKKSLKCAVKTVNEHATARERIDFLQEADVMKSFVDCHHVVKLLGIVSVGHPVFVLMEIMSNGDLRSYLRSHRPDDEEHPNAQPPSLSQLLQMAIEIADGMAYLSSRKFVHRDLAARNCMVAEDLTVKIGDFGMTRDIYETDYYRKGGKGLLPVRWMAPESLKDGVFTTYSDVWSYGVVLWEMATLASQPYQGLSNEAVLKYVVDGGKMQRPENCPQKIWDLMSLCWNRISKSRPNFIEVIEMLLSDANERFHEFSYYHQQKCSLTSLNDDVSSPLRLNSNTVQIEPNSVGVHYFPLSRTIAIPDNTDLTVRSDEENYDIDQIDEYSNADHLLLENNSQNKQLNDSSKGNSVQSSDGSKGSKISSTTSNGSIANGHALHYKTTIC